MKSKQQKLIEAARGAITTLALQHHLNLSDKDERMVKEGYDALQEMQRHEKRKVGTRYKGVSKSQWKKWNADEREVYNLIMKTILPMQIVIHPYNRGEDQFPHKDWRVLVHNIAFMVADEMRLRRKNDSR
jgi:hypothetical protein